MTKQSTGKPLINARYEAGIHLEAQVSSSQLPRLLHVLRNMFEIEATTQEVTPLHPLLARIDYTEFVAHYQKGPHPRAAGEIARSWRVVENHCHGQAEGFPIQVGVDAGERWLEGDLPYGLAMLREQGHGTVGVNGLSNILRERVAHLEASERVVAENAVILTTSESFS